MFDKVEKIFGDIAKKVQPLLDFAKTKNLEEKLPRDFVKERKSISELYFSVLTNKLLVREALLKFPENLTDETSITAYHALVHYEADEDLRKKDKMYEEAQMEYLIFIAETLQKGEKLPNNIIKGYKDYYRWAPAKYSDTKESIKEKLKRYINI